MEQHDAQVTSGRLELPVPGVSPSITFQVNGVEYQHAAPTTETLAQYLRNRLGLTGLKTGCGEGECGACTVLIDDQPVNSCLVLAFQVEGMRITTIEGLENADGTLSALQQAFIDHGAIQCGYCIPGMVIASEGLLRRNPAPEDTEIRRALAGNICRCTGFLNIIKAVKSVASANARAVPE
ncbi:MAG: (2Fe-2S)-binding protein [Gammaproteobacteria bacterium]|nr:(2Fe-2S)-binding protein [Gammaproteobacteria bacterium]